MSNTISHIIQQWKTNPDAPAVTVGKVTLTYSELLNRAFLLAKKLEVRNQNVGIYTDNNIDMYVGVLAIWFSGNAYVPINHKFPVDRLQKIVQESNVTLILESQVAESVHAGLASVQWINYSESSEKLGDDAYVPFEAAYTLFTSGSTGVPKGIPISHENLDALMEDMWLRYPLSQRNKVLQAFELSFDVSIACILLAWTQGAHLVVADLNGITAIQAFKSVYDHQVDFVVLPPSALFYIKKLKLLAMPMPWVKQTLFTGEALSWNVVQDWKTSAFYSEIDNAYGPTEGTVWSLIDTLDDSIEQQLVNGLCPIGQSLKTIQIQIVNDKGDQVAKGERGELWIGGPQIFHGYVNLQEKTNEVLFEEKGIRWYKTGDIVFQNEFDKIMYVNRKDNQVQINGYRVELGEVEHHLRNCLSSDAAVVLAHSNENVTELFAFIESEDKSEEQILDALRKNLPAYMVPRSVFILPSLPVNASGKIDKTNLRNTYLEI